MAAWDSFAIFASSTERIFAYINKSLIKFDHRLRQISEQCMRYFYENCYQKVKVKLTNALFK